VKTLTINQSFQVNFNYPVVFTDDAFSVENPVLGELFASSVTRPVKVLVVVDENVYHAHPQITKNIKRYAFAKQIDLVRKPLVVQGGEGIKGDNKALTQIYKLVAEEKIDRHSYILVIGGGAVLDAVGYAAATAHRGIRLVRMPSTVLAQNDAGVGVKNGINYLDRKNFLGSFAPPYAVVNDFSFLATLEERDKRSGIAEAVKVALIKDRSFFDELYENRHDLASFEPEATHRMIVRCAELHLEHIRSNGDPFEMGSARPLDFGHWSAHRLEALSNYRIRHGEAVAMGIALDTLYSLEQGMIKEGDWLRVWDLLSDLGFALSCQELEQMDVVASLEEFREHLGGRLSITLLTGVGSAIEVSDIDGELMQRCVDDILLKDQSESCTKEREAQTLKS